MYDNADFQPLLIQLHLLTEQAGDELGGAGVGGASPAASGLRHKDWAAGISGKDAEVQKEGRIEASWGDGI